MSVDRPQQTPGETPTWTLEEARAYLPRLRGLLSIVSRAADLASLSRGNGHSSLDVSGSPGASRGVSGVAEHGGGREGDPTWGVSPRQALEELSDRGIILRDASQALVDFPSRTAGGRPVLLCWQDCEDDIAWWHFPDDGFAGRRPLPVPPDL